MRTWTLHLTRVPVMSTKLKTFHGEEDVIAVDIFLQQDGTGLRLYAVPEPEKAAYLEDLQARGGWAMDFQDLERRVDAEKALAGNCMPILQPELGQTCHYLVNGHLHQLRWTGAPPQLELARFHLLFQTRTACLDFTLMWQCLPPAHFHHGKPH